MERKGQVEFIVILGLLVVIAVVIFYAYQSGLLTPVVSPDVSLAEDSVRNLIRAGAYQTLTNMSLYGGYLNADSFQMGSLTFNGKEVPYWQKNGQITYPDLHMNFKEGIKSYLIQNKDGFANAYTEEYGKEIVIGEPSVSANFMNDKIDLLVNMPTTLDGNAVPQPYTISISTRFEEIHDFSTGFLTFSSTNRPLEYFTLASMLMSPIKQGVHEVPIFLFLTDCGEMVYRSWGDVKPGAEYAIKTTLAHTYMPGKYPQNVLHTTSHPKYSIPPINGKEYENIDITFHLPDDFELTQNNLQFDPDPIFLLAEPVLMTSSCQSEPVFVKYFILYPTVVRVKDTLTGNSFHFATEVFIFNNTPGDWADMAGYIPSELKAICDNPLCSASLTVRDSSGNPIPYASVSFMRCNLGATNSQGRFVGTAPCGVGPLEVYKNGYGLYSEMKAADIEDLQVTLFKTPVINLYFHEVIVQNLSMNKQYMIRSDGIDWINARHPEIVYMNMFSYTIVQSNQLIFKNKMGRLSYMPPDDYVIGANMISDTTLVGAFILNYTITENMDGRDLHIYLPYIPEIANVESDEELGAVMVELTSLLKKCGLGPIRDTPVENFGGCIVGYNEL